MITQSLYNILKGAFGSPENVNEFTSEFGDGQWRTPVANQAALPTSDNDNGDVRVALDTQIIYIWNGLTWNSASGSTGITSLTGDVTATGPGSAVATISNDSVTNAKLANMATQTFKGRTTAGTGEPEDLTATQATAMLNVFTSGLQGLVPASGGGTTTFLRADGIFAVAGSGTIGGSSGSIDNAMIRADGTGGSTIQSSTSHLSDSGYLTLGGTGAPNYGLDLRASGAATPVYAQWTIPTTTGILSTDGTIAGLDSAGNFQILNQETNGTATVQTSNVFRATLAGTNFDHNFHTVTGTLPSTATAQYGVYHNITSGGSGTNGAQGALLVGLAAGYTGSNSTWGVSINNTAAGTNGGTLSTSNGNMGIQGAATATTTGYNYGTSGYAQSGNINVGAMGLAPVNKNSAVNIGVLGFARNTATSPTEIGGFFGLKALMDANPSFTSAALIADNSGTSSPVFLGRVSGTTHVSISSTGVFAAKGTTTNDNASTGHYGEYTSASVAQGSAVSLTTATPATITSITLTAGDWDVHGVFNLTGTLTGTQFIGAIGETTNSLAGTVLGDTQIQTPTVSLAGSDSSITLPAVRKSLSGTTTIYLITQATFTAGTAGGYGRISARRVR